MHCDRVKWSIMIISYASQKIGQVAQKLDNWRYTNTHTHTRCQDAFRIKAYSTRRIYACKMLLLTCIDDRDFEIQLAKTLCCVGLMSPYLASQYQGDLYCCIHCVINPIQTRSSLLSSWHEWHKIPHIILGGKKRYNTWSHTAKLLLVLLFFPLVLGEDIGTFKAVSVWYCNR